MLNVDCRCEQIVPLSQRDEPATGRRSLNLGRLGVFGLMICGLGLGCNASDHETSARGSIAATHCKTIGSGMFKELISTEI